MMDGIGGRPSEHVKQQNQEVALLRERLREALEELGLCRDLLEEVWRTDLEEELNRSVLNRLSRLKKIL